MFTMETVISVYDGDCYWCLRWRLLLVSTMETVISVYDGDCY